MAKSFQNQIICYLRSNREKVMVKLHCSRIGVSVSTFARDVIMQEVNKHMRDSYDSNPNLDNVGFVSETILESKDPVIDRSMFEDDPNTSTPAAPELTTIEPEGEILDTPTSKSIFPPASSSIENIIKNLFDEE